MDISVLPNNNHPEKFLQLDVGILDATHGMFQVGAFVSSQRRWQNRVYLQVWSNRATTTLQHAPSSQNPLYMDIKSIDTADNERFKPSWTIKEYDTQTIHGNLTDYLKDTKTPKELDFWLEDLYTPGFDSLLKRKEAEHKRKRLSKIVLSVILLICASLIVIIVPIVVLQHS
uniref:Major intrinsically disordered Notch2-binding receptor 1-like C-terminal domain-containing protein n=1 Tax=Poecilia mexicana TaxID=48701 RepID=A0A3B3YXW7_9TELE